MEANAIKWCPQHGYPLPCYKCGMPLSQTSQKEIYELGEKAGIREVVEWIKASGDTSLYSQNGEYTDEWQAKLKEWGINEEGKDGS